MNRIILKYKPEALEETINHVSSNTDRQEWANETLAKILEIVRNRVNSAHGVNQSDYSCMKQIIDLFPQ